MLKARSAFGVRGLAFGVSACGRSRTMAQDAANPRRDRMGRIGPMGHPISPISPKDAIRLQRPTRTPYADAPNAKRQTPNAKPS